MDGLIRRQDVINIISDEIYNVKGKGLSVLEANVRYIGENKALGDLVIRLLKIPTVDINQKESYWIEKISNTTTLEAEPVRHGKWIDETFKPWGLVHHPYKCDQCGEHSESDSNYCPNCGAKMDGEREGE